MKRRPESIARSCEMVLRRRRIQARIDPAEQNLKMLRDDIGHTLPGRGKQLRTCGTVDLSCLCSRHVLPSRLARHRHDASDLAFGGMTHQALPQMPLHIGPLTRENAVEN